MYKHILYDLTDDIATVTLNRPEKYNAIDQAMREDFYTLADQLRTDSSRVVIITGIGKAFSSGGDVKHFEHDWPTLEFRAGSHLLSRFYDDLEALEKPVIAAINGVATGAGLQLAMVCDLRFASTEARVGYREHFLSLIPGHGGTARLVKLIGLSRAKMLYYTGDLVSADEAYQIGLLNRIVPPDELMPTTLDFARKLAKRAPQSLGLAKRLLNASANVDTQSAILLESMTQSLLIKTDDHKEGLRAFREKDMPTYTGE